MPMRGGSLGYGIPGGTQSGSTTVNGYTVPQDLTLTGNRTGAQPAEYVAASNVEFTGEFESASSDEFTAYIADASYAGTGNQSNGGTGANLAGGYRYGFNGKENDADVKGDGNEIDYGTRVYDPRIGKFLSVDPLQAKFPFYSPYQFAGNTPIQAIDLDGLEPLKYFYALKTAKDGKTVIGVTFSGDNGGAKWPNDPKKPEYRFERNDGVPFIEELRFSSLLEIEKYAIGKTLNQISQDGGDALNGISRQAFLTQLSVEGHSESVMASAQADVSFSRVTSYAADESGFFLYPWVFSSAKGNPTPTGNTNKQSAAANNGNTEAAKTNTATNSSVEEWKGPVNYSGLKQPNKVGPGMETTRAQRLRILNYNKKMNGGVLRSDEDGSILDWPTNVPAGGKSNMNQAEVDHIDERINGGSNSNSNQRVISKKQNLQKESQRIRKK